MTKAAPMTPQEQEPRGLEAAFLRKNLKVEALTREGWKVIP